MAKPSITFYPKMERRTNKTGRVPIYARLVLNRQKTEYRLPVDVNINSLSDWNQMFMKFPEEIESDANRIITKFQQIFNDIVFQHAHVLDQLNVKSLKGYVFGIKEDKLIDVKFYLRNYFHENIEKGTSITIGTKKNYIKAINHFERFLKFVKKEDLQLSLVHNSIGSEFYDYLKKSYPQYDKKPLTDASASGNVIRIKHLFDKALEKNLIKSNPFGGLKLNTRCPKRGKLNTIEVQSLYKVDLSTNYKLDKVRDLFLFSVFTGLAYSDVMELKKVNIQIDSNGEYFMEIKRHKTDIIVNQYLPLQAIQIINKYELCSLYKETVLPKISNQYYNDTLKELGVLCNINKKVSTHIARHTFRQLLAEAEVIDLAAIKTMMGHSRNSDIDSIYHDVTSKQLLNAKNKYQEFINRLLN